MNTIVDKKQISVLHAGLTLRTAQWSNLNAVVDLVRDVLYDNAGMHVHQAFDRYEKEFRPGKEISVQSL
jgi:hypothetical protein